MPLRLTLVTLGVSDIARARRFYTRLGCPVLEGSNDSVAFLDAGGTLLGLFGRAALAEDAGVSDQGSGFSGVTLAWNVSSPAEADQVLADAQAAGGRLQKAAGPTFWGGYAGYFADPDGHLWEVAHNPFWPLDERGQAPLNHLPRT